MWHLGSEYHSDPGNMAYRLMADVPLKVFRVPLRWSRRAVTCGAPIACCTAT